MQTIYRLETLKEFLPTSGGVVHVLHNLSYPLHIYGLMKQFQKVCLAQKQHSTSPKDQHQAVGCCSSSEPGVLVQLEGRMNSSNNIGVKAEDNLSAGQEPTE